MSLFKLNLKTIFWAIAAIVILFLAITLLGFFAPRIEKYLAEREEQRFIVQYEKLQQEIEEAYKNDTYGGKTPEETFDMFLDALKKGDIELASKYYELSVQPKALENLKKRVIDNTLDKKNEFFRTTCRRMVSV